MDLNARPGEALRSLPWRLPPSSDADTSIGDAEEDRGRDRDRDTFRAGRDRGEGGGVGSATEPASACSGELNPPASFFLWIAAVPRQSKFVAAKLKPHTRCVPKP